MRLSEKNKHRARSKRARRSGSWGLRVCRRMRMIWSRECEAFVYSRKLSYNSAIGLAASFFIVGILTIDFYLLTYESSKECGGTCLALPSLQGDLPWFKFYLAHSSKDKRKGDQTRVGDLPYLTFLSPYPFSLSYLPPCVSTVCI